MRSCIYCGKELKEGEQCDCPQSAAHRKAKAEKDRRCSKRHKKPAQLMIIPVLTERTAHTGQVTQKKESKIKHAWDRHKNETACQVQQYECKKLFCKFIRRYKKVYTLTCGYDNESDRYRKGRSDCNIGGDGSGNQPVRLLYYEQCAQRAVCTSGIAFGV